MSMDRLIELFRSFWPLITAIVTLILSLSTAAHAIIYKRDSRATVAWVGLIWLTPVLGSILYLLLGVNRVQRRAVRRTENRPRLSAQMTQSVHAPAVDTSEPAFSNPWVTTPAQLTQSLTGSHGHLAEMAQLTRRLTGLPLLRGNQIDPLLDGDEAYPAMLEAIDSARRSITLTIYIFSRDSVGNRFIEALGRAVARGVEVRVLIDAVGARYSSSPVIRPLRRLGVRTATFMSGIFLWRMPYFNLRSHRKIMVVDAKLGFTGGMNIRNHCMLSENPSHPTRDTHFRVRGPVVEQLQWTFVDDWYFTTGEELTGPPWFAEQYEEAGNTIARCIPDGPDQDLDKMSMGFQGALASAQQRVRIVTPYFLPDRALIAALNTTAMRGVSVDIVIPERSNLRMVEWACMAQLWQILEWGCRVWLSPPPFDHSKLMVVDSAFCLIGSSNWDQRSLRLNFELGMECYDHELALTLETEIDSRIARSRETSKEEVDARSIPVQLRDGMMRLFAPFL